MTALLATSSLALASSAQAQTINDLYPELATIVASDGGNSDILGAAVALDGDTLAIGAPYDDVGANVDQGSVRIYVRSGGSWTLQATLTAADGAPNDYFGDSLSLDGDTLAVGVPSDDVGANAIQGSVRVYVRSGTTWSLQATLTASDGGAGDYFGWSVSLEGDTLAVGVPDDDVGANAAQGSVRVFARSGTSWSAWATLLASDGAAGDSLGRSVSLSGDTIAAGAPLDDIGLRLNQGSVRVFARSGFTWAAQSTLVAIDGDAEDYFGIDVSLDGQTLAVGVPYDEVGANFDQGSVRIFTRSGTNWSAQASLALPDGGSADNLGFTVALQGNTLVAGAPYARVGLNSLQGRIGVFTRDSASWTSHAGLVASDGKDSDLLAISVALDGETIVAGSQSDDIGTGFNQGSARVFGNYRVFNDTRGTGHGALVSAISSAFAGDRLLVGAPAFNEAPGIVDASQKRLTYTALEPITIPQSTMMLVANNSVFEKSPDVAAGGLSVGGKLIAPIGGSVTFEALGVVNEGQFVQQTATVLVNNGLSSASGGVCYLQGRVVAETVSTAVGGQNRCTGDTDVLADYTNAGSTIVQRGILYIYGTLVNTGTITGEVDNGFLPPAAGDGYAIGGDYAVSADSSIVLPDPVWWLRVGGSLDMAINSPSRFVMNQATLEMSGVGASAEQSLEVFGADLGAVEAGFATTNFPLGALRIRAGANVSLVDSHNNAPGKGQEAIYTDALFVPAGATLTTNGYRIYTRAATVAGTVSDPADIIVVEGAPPCPADIFPDGLVNAVDLSALIAAWGPCTGSCAADLDGNGSVGASDLSILLAAWGACGQ